MFTVGYEIDFRPLRGRDRAAPLVVATSALLVPFALGCGVALAGRGTFLGMGETNAGSRSFVLFMGVATSVTALPVLAAIIRERGLAGSRVGTIATAAAGIMDVIAWLLLAVALTGTKAAGSRPWLVTAVVLVVFVAVMLLVVRPALQWWTRRPNAVLSNQVPLALVLTAASGWVTGSIGLHPVFGAFLAGLTMPRPGGAPDADVLGTMERAGGLLLPLFFVATGLTMNIGGLSGGDIVLLLVVVAVAMLGKMGPAYAAARLSRLDRPQSAMIAALVNTRGLTELIALNVGLSAGIIHQRLFTVLVLMALITTIATGPLIKRKAPPSGVSSRPQDDAVLRDDLGPRDDHGLRTGPALRRKSADAEANDGRDRPAAD